MSKIRVAGTAGFCFGVARAVSICEQLAAAGRRAATLGPIIHNQQVVDALAKKGIRRVDSLDELADGEVLVIRSHGAVPSIYEQCEQRGIEIVDATCPYVAKIHRIVEARNGAEVVVIGNAEHPEIEALVGHCGGDAHIFSDLDALKAANLRIFAQKPAIMVAQTTYNLLQYNECVDYAKSIFSDFIGYDTVCGATRERQAEAARIAAESDVCIVIGDTKSSNTRKLCEVCESSCPTFLVQTAGDIDETMFRGAHCVGITAGASTPAGIIEEVLIKMSEIFKDETMEQTAVESEDTDNREEDLNFEEAVEMYLKRASRNQRYVGTVTSVQPNEVVVDIGTKQTGIVPADEMTDDGSVKLEDIVKKGDKLNLVAISVSDIDGIVTLSKKRLDAIDGFGAVTKAAQDGTVLEAFVTEKVNAGLIAYYKGVRIFIHESQTTLHKGESYDNLIKTNVKLKITDVRGPHSVRGSIRRVILDERDEKRDEFWQTVENGKKYTGKVKSITSYGAFVDLGGVDGMVHISELSWGRVKNPSDVVSVGDVIDVYVKNADKENRKISLGYKKEEDNPWNKLRAVPLGTVFKGAVVSVVKYGAFVRIMPEIDGFIHISELANDRVEKTTDVVKVGDEVEAKLIGIDFDRQRVSLSLRDENAKPEEDTKGVKAKLEDAAEDIRSAAGNVADAVKAAAQKVAEVSDSVGDKLGEKFEDLSADAADTADAIGDAVEEAGEKAKKTAKKTKEKAAEVIDDIKDKAAEVGAAVKKTAKKAAEKIDELGDKVEDKVEETVEKVKKTRAKKAENKEDKTED